MGRRKLPSHERDRRHAKRDRPICDYFRTQLPRDPQRGDVEKAIQATMERFGKDRRDVQKALQRQRWAPPAVAVDLIETLDRIAREGRLLDQVNSFSERILANWDLVEKWLTKGEIAQMLHVDFSILVRIARERKALSELLSRKPQKKARAYHKSGSESAAENPTSKVKRPISRR